MTEPDNSILCTCGPWNGVIPPPPCPVHRSPEWHDQVREWATTIPTTPVFTEEMIRRAMGQEPCDVSDVPFCGWGDLIPEPVKPEPSPPEDEGVEVEGLGRYRLRRHQIERKVDKGWITPLSPITPYIEHAKVAIALGLVDPPALPPEVAAVVDAAKAWHTAMFTLDVPHVHRRAAQDALREAVDALLAAERASTEEDR